MKSYAGLVSSGSLFHRSQAKTRTAWSCCQTHRGRPSKPDPSDLLRSPRRCPTISWLETRSWSTSHSGSIRSAGTQEYQWPMLCSWQKNARFGDKSQWRDATAECFASWWWRWNSHEELKSIGDHVSIFSCLEHYVVQMTLLTHAVIVRQDHTRRVVTTR